MSSDEIEPCCYQGVIRDQKGVRLGIALLIAYVDDIWVCSENDEVQDMVEKAIGAVVPLKVTGCIENFFFWPVPCALEALTVINLLV